jgi:LacI family transcriptional regulator
LFRIGIQLDFAGGYGRGVLTGMLRYARSINPGGGWEFVMPPMYQLSHRRIVEPHSADGVVAMIHHAKSLAPFRRRRIPVVNTAATLTLRELQTLRIPTVLPDDAAVGALAFRYLNDRGFKQFAFCGHPRAAWSVERRNSFVKACREAGYPCSVTAAADQVSQEWVRSLERPCAVLAANDRYAWHMIDVCRELGIPVPEQIAVLGVDNDTLLTEMVRPTLSSIILPAERIGYEAARLLDLMLSGKQPKPRVTVFPPEGVATRHTTDVLSIEDDAVADAARFIREHAAEPVGVADVLELVSMSRRNLERRFRKALGRSLLDEIRRVRMDRAAYLLRETDMKMTKIADQVGFSSAIRLSSVFKELMGLPPSEYRRQHRATG